MKILSNVNCTPIIRIFYQICSFGAHSIQSLCSIHEVYSQCDKNGVPILVTRLIQRSIYELRICATLSFFVEFWLDTRVFLHPNLISYQLNIKRIESQADPNRLLILNIGTTAEGWAMLVDFFIKLEKKPFTAEISGSLREVGKYLNQSQFA